MIINERAIRNRLNCRVSSLDENVKKLKVLLMKASCAPYKDCSKRSIKWVKQKGGKRSNKKLYNRYFKKFNFIFIYIYGCTEFEYKNAP